MLRYRDGESLPESHARAQRAFRLRREAAAPERALCSKLSSRHLGVLKFQRLYTVGVYTLDYYLEEATLAVEAEGNCRRFTPALPEQRSSPT